MSDISFEKWITYGTDRPFYARRNITLEGDVKSATAYVCGLGQFNFYINGKRASDHVLDPAWSDYNKIVYYVKFDVTEALNRGENVLAAEVGNGWYNADDSFGYFFHFPSFMPPNPNPYKPYGKELVLGLRLEVEYADGKKETIETDEEWLVAEHAVTNSNCFGSERIDGYRSIRGWNGLNSEDRKWTKAKIAEDGNKLNDLLEEQTMPPIRVAHSFPGKYMSTSFGKSIYDFGQNTSGMLKFEVRGKAGEVVTALPAEKLTENGDVDQMAKKWLPIDVREEYVISSDDTWEEFSMTFTYFGGRYVGIDKDPEDIRNIRLDAITSAYEDAGSFSCDDERVMKIYSLIENSIESNMVSVHTDCPTIERFAWQEENHLMAPSIMYLKNVTLHWEKFLTDTRLSQHTGSDWFNDMHHGRYYPGDGLIPAQAPCYIPNVLPVPGMGDFYNIIGWGSSIIIGTYWHYMFYGDDKIISDNYEAGKKYLEFLKTMVNADGFINNGLGDWGNPTGEYARENVETAFLYADAKYMGFFAKVLGRNTDHESFIAYADSVKENYNEKLLVFDQSSGRYGYRVFDKKDAVVMTQAAEAMPLYFGMVPEDKKADVLECLKRTLVEAGCLKTGEVAQPYIIQTMAENGMNQMLFDMILKPEHPSYYAFVLAGETTLGEYWEENPRSHNHDMMGHIMEWFYNGIAGIKPLEPGFKKILIEPFLPKSMNHMVCTYNSVSGMIKVELNRRDGTTFVNVYADDEIEYEVSRKNLEG